jgi:hypothetical protein
MVSEMYERCPRAAGAPAGRPARGEGGERAGLTLAQAEGLLDWLEAHGRTGLGACLLEDGGVTVYWDVLLGFGR